MSYAASRPYQVIVVDDEPLIHRAVGEALADLPYELRSFSTYEDAKAWLAGGPEAVVLLDVDLPDANGIARFEELQQVAPHNRIILMTGKDHSAHLVAATMAGAYDFINKRSDFTNRLKISTRNAMDALTSRRLTTRPPVRRLPSDDMIAASSRMQLVMADVRKLSSSKVSVLIQGQSGTGKEVAARAIHDSGSRAHKPFVAVNCAGIPDTLLESELFGYERGAFTGAVSRRLGRFETARGGTILLDEIGEMSLQLQAKLLRVVQDGRFERLGGSETIEADVRIVSATNRDLMAMVKEQNFREDLYYRLAVFTLELPPLTERKEDIEPLLNFFLKRACADEGRVKLPAVSAEVLEVMLKHHWPGNVRQLQNVVKHAVVMGDDSLIKIGDLPSSFTSQLRLTGEEAHAAMTLDRANDRQQLDIGPVNLRLEVALERCFPDAELLPTAEQLERAGLRLVMKRLGNNRKKVAEVLGLSRATLYRRLADDPSLG